mmetsp:Transcript_33277/g.86279  ORF Transcript_33277/g.86279 Transcript_33277/m.86279 type:complete len:361 (-) Transcript_33277:144-1226(-)
MSVIRISSTTWTRDSHDLFDYETRHVITSEVVLRETSKVLRQGTEVRGVLDTEEIPAEPRSDYLVKVAERQGSFYVLPPDRSSGNATPASKRLWLVVSDLPQRNHHVMEGDIIKLGRFKLRVRQVVPSAVDGGVVPQLNLDDTELLTVEDQEQLHSTPCRICLLEGAGAPDDPLVSPCKCKGSIRYVHLACLRHWINGRLNFEGSGSYFYKQLPCELCHEAYPAYLVEGADQRRTPLVQVPHTEPPFVVLENSVRESQSAQRGLHVISLAEQKVLKLGRGHESDVRIADVSISRCHATMRFHRGAFVLEDHASKFGTLVAMRKTRPIDSNTLTVQCGRTVLRLQQDAALAASEGEPQREE